MDKIREKAKIVVIGGNGAGCSAISSLLREGINGSDIFLIEKLPYISYASCSLPYFLDNSLEWDELFTGVEKRFLKAGVKLLLETEVKELDFKKRKILLLNLKENKTYYLEYEKAILASGAVPAIPFKVSENSRIFTLRNPTDAKKLKSVLQNNSPRKIAIIGAGLIGLEMLYSFSKWSPHQLHLFDTKGIFSNENPTLTEVIAKIIQQKLNVQLHFGKKILAVESSSSQKVAVVGNNWELKFDLVFVATGVRPFLDYLNITSRYLDINSDFSTDLPSLWGCGDCIRTFNYKAFAQKIYFPTGSFANRSGRLCGLNLAGRRRKLFTGIINNLVIKTEDFEYGSVGKKETDLNRDNGEKIFFHKSQTKAGKLGENYPVLTQIITDRRGKVLGATMVGKEGIAKRIDLWSLFIKHGYNLEEVYETQLSYQPQISPVWDPILMAAYSAMRRL